MTRLLINDRGRYYRDALGCAEADYCSGPVPVAPRSPPAPQGSTGTDRKPRASGKGSNPRGMRRGAGLPARALLSIIVFLSTTFSGARSRCRAFGGRSAGWGVGVWGVGCGVSAAPRGSAAASSSSPDRCLHPSRSLVTAVGDSWQAPPETCIWEIPIGAEGKGGAAIRREQFILLFNSRLATPALSGGSRSKRLSQRCLSPRPRYGKGLGMSGPGLKAHHPNQTPGFSGPRDESCP